MAGFGATLAPVANQLITLFGDGRTATLTRVKNGSIVDGPITGVEYVVVDQSYNAVMGFQHGERVLIFSAAQFDGDEMDKHWTFEADSGDTLKRNLSGPFQPVKPGTDTVYYSAVLNTGGGR